jgi:hypothetical protein
VTLLEILGQVTDKRRTQGRRYDLPNFLLVSILAMLCGARTYKDIAIFMESRLPNLKAKLHLNWKSSPKRTMVNDTFKAIDINSLEHSFRDYSNKLLDNMDKEDIMPSMDGKTLRGSYDHKNGEKALHLLMAFCGNNKLVLGHINVTDSKSNEIPCAQNMLSELGVVEGSVYTLDALHCQKKLSPK